MQVRRFNDRGTAAFEAFLDGARHGEDSDPPTDFLINPEFTESLSADVAIDASPLKSRRNAAERLASALEPIHESEVEHDAGLWTWLSLLFFDDVAPKSNGKRTVRNDYQYVYAARSQRYWYRHLLFIAWHVFRIAPEHNRLYLDKPVAPLDKYTELTLKSLHITRIPCIFEVLDRLYWLDAEGRPRTAMTSPERATPGNLYHRLPLRLRQIEKTFDLISLNADQLIELLGEEFQALDRSRSTLLI